MKRETRSITREEAYYYATNWYDLSNEKYQIVSNVCESSDPEDGGGYYRTILKDKETGQFFEFYYSEWDIENTDYDEEEDKVDGRCDLSTTIKEVFEKKVVKVEYS
jgi:hypothetical protein